MSDTHRLNIHKIPTKPKHLVDTTLQIRLTIVHPTSELHKYFPVRENCSCQQRNNSEKTVKECQMSRKPNILDLQKGNVKKI